MVATDVLVRSWWVLALRGVLAILFGIAAIAWPGITLAVVVGLFGAYAILDGIGAVLTMVRHPRRGSWLVVLVEGVIGIGAGVVALLVPGITAMALVFVIGVWAFVTGIMEVAAAFRLRREMEDEWLLGLAGIVSTVFGLALILFPGAGVIALLSFIAAFVIVFGIAMLLLGLRLRSAGRRGFAV